ncbi:MAG: DsbA family protein, partial [Xanthobacteraceae bacterium]
DVARIEKDLASDEVKASLEEAFKLAEKLGLNGTPSYVVGPNVVVGAVGFEALKEKVESARACAKTATCCSPRAFSFAGKVPISNAPQCRRFEIPTAPAASSF